MFPKKLLSVLTRLFVLLFLYQCSRLSFFLLNHAYFSELAFKDYLSISYYGFLFDISAICQLNIIFFLLYLLPFRFASSLPYRKILNILFFTVNAFALMFNFIDCEYFRYINKRSTFDIFSYLFVSSDTVVLLPRFFLDFWYIPFLWFAALLAGYFLISRTDTYFEKKFEFSKPLSLFVSIPVVILVFALCAIGIRGTGFKPLQLMTASRYTSTENIPLILNSPFSILHTMKQDAVNKVHYFDDKQAVVYFNPIKKYDNNKAEKKDNVVIIILESFSYDYVSSLSGQKGYTPFLDSLISHSLVFDNAFANGKRSIEALPALFASIPNLLNESYITSQYSSNQICGLPKALQNHGYTTSFFHGGRNGTMGFDNFCKAAGIEQYYGMNEYSGPAAYDGDWGIRDEEFLQFYAHKLDSFKQPFFSSVFTLSSHEPYTVPDKYKKRFTGGALPIYKSIQYADYSLSRFFKTISKTEWYKHTLFIITADHAAQEEDYEHKKRIDLFRIPIVFFHPSDTNLVGRNHCVVQQADVMPSVLDYLNVKGSYVSFGNSVFDSTAAHFAVQYLGGTYSIVEQNATLNFDGERVVESSCVQKQNVKLEQPLCVQLEHHLKSVIQQFNARLIDNKMIAK